MADQETKKAKDVLAAALKELGAKDALEVMNRAYPKVVDAALTSGADRIPIEPEDLRKLAELNLTIAEAAAFFNCSLATMKRRLAEPVYRQAWERGRMKTRRMLRTTQLETALNDKNVTMQIWLGKQLLDQKDRPMEIDVNVYDRSEVTISMDDFEKMLDDAEQEVIHAEYEVIDGEAGGATSVGGDSEVHEHDVGNVGGGGEGQESS